MIVTEYDDCLSFKYSDIPDDVIDRKTRPASIELDLLNGKKVEVNLAVRRKKDGTHKVIEVLLPKDLSEEEIDDIADLYWYIFPEKERGRKLYPVVDCWRKDGMVLAACLSQKYGIGKKPFGEQWAPFERENIPPDPDRQLCWWPDSRVWEAMKEMIFSLRTGQKTTQWTCCTRAVPARRSGTTGGTASIWSRQKGSCRRNRRAGLFKGRGIRWPVAAKTAG